MLKLIGNSSVVELLALQRKIRYNWENSVIKIREQEKESNFCF